MAPSPSRLVNGSFGFSQCSIIIPKYFPFQNIISRLNIMIRRNCHDWSLVNFILKERERLYFNRPNGISSRLNTMI